MRRTEFIEGTGRRAMKPMLDPERTMLCSGCNRSKGGKTMAEWRAARND